MCWWTWGVFDWVGWCRLVVVVANIGVVVAVIIIIIVIDDCCCCVAIVFDGIVDVDYNYDCVYSCFTISSSAPLTPITNATLSTLSHCVSPSAYSQTSDCSPTLISASHYDYY